MNHCWALTQLNVITMLQTSYVVVRVFQRRSYEIGKVDVKFARAASDTLEIIMSFSSYDGCKAPTLFVWMPHESLRTPKM